jgi:hypothetical protein
MAPETVPAARMLVVPARAEERWSSRWPTVAIAPEAAREVELDRMERPADEMAPVLDAAVER